MMIRHLFPYLLVLAGPSVEEAINFSRTRQLQPDPPDVDPPDVPDAPVNCSTASLIEELPYVNGAFISEAPEIGSEVPLCDDFLAQDTRAIWYVVEGNGLCFTASLASSDFNTLLQIYNGDCPENLMCVVGGSEEEEVSWKTLNLQRYYILVGGFEDTGGFTLSIQVKDECDTDPPSTNPPTDPPTDPPSRTNPPTDPLPSDPPTDPPTSNGKHLVLPPVFITMALATSVFVLLAD